MHVMKRQFQAFQFTIQNTANDAVDIHIDGTIVDAETQSILKDWFGDDTSVSYKSFRDNLNSITANTFNVYINSGGGLVTDAMAIHDLLIDLQDKGKTVNTIGRGIIASAATYILMAGKNASMSSNSWFMIHNVSGGIYGDVNMVENYAAMMRKFNNASADFYASATGLSRTVISNMMNAETWMTAQEAKDKGFIKNISGNAAFKQTISSEHWQYSNTAVLNSYNKQVKNAYDDTSLNDKERSFLESMISLEQQAIDLAKNIFPNVQNPFVQGLAGDIISDNTDDIEEMNDYLQGEPVEDNSKINFRNKHKNMKSFFQDIKNAMLGIKPTDNTDTATITNEVAEAVAKPFENLHTEIENEITQKVDTATAKLKADNEAEIEKQVNAKLEGLVNAAVAAATKGLVSEEDLQKEITNLKGKPSSSKEEDNDAKPIGKRVNY